MTRAVYLRRETNLPLAILMGCSARSIRMAINTLAQDLVDGGNALGNAVVPQVAEVVGRFVLDLAEGRA